MGRKKLILVLTCVPVLVGLFVPSGTTAADGSSKLNISVKNTVFLSLDSDVLNINIDNFDLQTGSLGISAGTNNKTGYTISFSTSSENAELKRNSDQASEYFIPTITESVAAESFPTIGWGYKTLGNAFNPIPLETTNIFNTTTYGENTNDFTIGTRADATIAAGTYSCELVFTIVPNPLPVDSISHISKMQQMTPDVCDASAENESKQLEDIRDGKKYWVTKLKDGNCWMTQNLDYDLSVASNQNLVPETSNVAETRTVTPVSWGTNADAIYYRDGGDTYYANGIAKTEGFSSLPEDDARRHYAQGDYYSWKAATAGQGTSSIKNTDVNESICPAGWRLPTANSTTEKYSFGSLLKQYGYSGTNQNAPLDVLLASPLFFIRGGRVFSNSLYAQNDNGFYWSSMAYSDSSRSYYLSLTKSSSAVYPDDTYYPRYDGFNVRCVAL